MKQTIPNSPFSTRLSGSAKETELRLQSIFRWKKKRPPVVLLFLTALIVLLCFGLFSCQSAPEKKPPQENGPYTDKPDDPSDEILNDPAAVLSAMETVKAGDFTDPEYFGNVSAAALSAALNAAADKQISEEEFAGIIGANHQLFPHWILADVWLEGDSGGHAGTDRHFSIYCGLPDDIVEVVLSEDDRMSRVYVRDEKLYRLVRHSDDREEVIDAQACERFRDLLTAEMETTLSSASNNPGDFTGYELIRFTPVWDWEDTSGGRVVLYDFFFGLLTDRPEDVGWAGGMTLDGHLRVIFSNTCTQLAVKYQGDSVLAAAFMDAEFYYDGQDPSLTDWAKTNISRTLSQNVTGSLERTGTVMALTEDAWLISPYSYTCIDPEDSSACRWFRLNSGYELKKGDIVLVLERSDGTSRVVIPYGDIPWIYGFVDSSLLSSEGALIKEAGQAIIAYDVHGYAAPAGTVPVTTLAPCRVRVLERNSGWAYVQPMSTGAAPVWMDSSHLYYGFSDEPVIDAPEGLPIAQFP